MAVNPHESANARPCADSRRCPRRGSGTSATRPSGRASSRTRCCSYGTEASTPPRPASSASCPTARRGCVHRPPPIVGPRLRRTPVLTACLLVAALAAGVTGAWSPCGLSMVETLAPGGFARTRAESALAARHVRGSARSRAGRSRSAGSRCSAPGSAPAARPPWAPRRSSRSPPRRPRRAGCGSRRRSAARCRRRGAASARWPSPTAGYGVLLGLGFTTFVLTFAVWALAGASIALGDPALGLGVGLAFGLGRALPVIALAPRAHAATAVMCERPGILLGLRRVDAVALAAVALALGTAPREAAARPGPRRSRRSSSPGTPTTPPPAPACSRGSDPTGWRCCAATARTGRCPAASRARRERARVARGRRGRDRGRRTGVLRGPGAAPGAQVIGVSDEILAWRAPDRTAATCCGRCPRRQRAGGARAGARGGELGRPAVAGGR